MAVEIDRPGHPEAPYDLEAAVFGGSGNEQAPLKAATVSRWSPSGTAENRDHGPPPIGSFGSRDDNELCKSTPLTDNEVAPGTELQMCRRGSSNRENRDVSWDRDTPEGVCPVPSRDTTVSASLSRRCPVAFIADRP